MAARQHGVVSRKQLRDLGFTDASIARAMGAGRLHPVFRGVVAVGHPQIGERGRMLAAVLACGEGSVVSHRTAAALLGLHEPAPAVIDVIGPDDAGRAIDGIRRYYVPAPSSKEVGLCDSVPCTSPARTLVDLAGLLGERSLRRVVEQAAVLGVLDLPAIEQALSRARRRGAPLLREVLSDWQTIDAGSSRGAEHPSHLRSELEARLLALIGASKLPIPQCNRAIGGDGKRMEVDFLWPDQRLVVEADGRRFHDSPVAFERDRLRDRALQLAGYRVVRFTHDQIESEPEIVVSTIRRLLASR